MAEESNAIGNKIVSLAMVLIIIKIGINLYLLDYVKKLEHGCECSKDWKRDYLKYYLYFTLIVALISSAILLKPNLADSPLNIFLGGDSIIAIASIIIIYLYIRQLRSTACECSKGTQRNVLEIINIIKFSFVVIGLLAAFGMGSLVLIKKATK